MGSHHLPTEHKALRCVFMKSGVSSPTLGSEQGTSHSSFPERLVTGRQCHLLKGVSPVASLVPRAFLAQMGHLDERPSPSSPALAPYMPSPGQLTHFGGVPWFSLGAIGQEAEGVGAPALCAQPLMPLSPPPGLDQHRMRLLDHVLPER